MIKTIHVDLQTPCSAPRRRWSARTLHLYENIGGGGRVGPPTREHVSMCPAPQTMRRLVTLWALQTREHVSVCSTRPKHATLWATHGQILSQSPADATSGR